MSLLDTAIPPATVRRQVLPNGLRVLVRQDTSAPVVAIVTYVKAGYFDETDDIVGVAHVLEHMYFKGTPSLGVGEIARVTKANGGYLNAGTIYDHTHYYAVLPSTGFAAGLAVQADAYANSLIDASELARELEVIIEEAKRKQDNPTALATETLFELLHDQHRMRRWRIGREAGLRTLERAHVDRFYRNFYRPSNTVLSIVGDVDPDAALALVTQLYGGLADAPVVRTPGPAERTGAAPAFRYRELSGDIQQAELVFGWRTPALLHPDTPALDLVSAVLSSGRASRLYRGVRERRLASSVNSANYTPTDLGVFTMHIVARAELAVPAARAAWDQLRCVRDGAVTTDEVDRARRVLEASWLRRFATMEGQANHLASWELLGGWERAGDYLDALLSTDAATIADVAQRYLAPELGGLVAYRPASAPAFAIDAAMMRERLDAERPAPLAVATRPGAATPVSPARSVTLDRVDGAVRVYRTAEGMPVLVQRRSGAIGYLGWFARGGSSTDAPSQAGLASMAARTALKGTQRRGSQRLAEDAEFLGGVLSSSASPDLLQFTLSVPVRQMADAAELLGDVVQRPSFLAEAFEAERAVALASLASMRDDMYRWPMRVAQEAAWAGHPYGRSLLGTDETLARMTPDDLMGFHRTHVLESSGAVVIVADMDPDDAAALAGRAFGGLRVGSDPKVGRAAWPPEMHRIEESRDKAQSALAILFEGPSGEEDARTSASLIASVASGLGGRFFDELRDRQSLAYSVMAAPLVRRSGGAFAAYIAMSPEKLEQAERGLLAEFAKLCESPVTAKELEQAKTYLRGSWAIRRESSAAVASDLADAWLFGRSLEEIEAYDGRIRAATASDLLDCARRYFDPTRRVTAVIRGAERRV